MKNDSMQSRDGFKSRGGFIIACIGSAVGMGNIWRFPMLVSTWGGLTFLIPYFIFVILIGSTGVIGEFALGRAGGAGPMGSFGMCTELRWGKRKIGERIGYIPILGSLVQKAILASLAERKGTTYRLATPDEESVGIDGYVGNVPYSVKPDTYKTMGRLSETIAVKMIYYTKTKTGLTVEVEE